MYFYYHFCKLYKMFLLFFESDKRKCFKGQGNSYWLDFKAIPIVNPPETFCTHSVSL